MGKMEHLVKPTKRLVVMAWVAVAIGLSGCQPALKTEEVAVLPAEAGEMHVNVQILATPAKGAKKQFNAVWERVNLGDDIYQDNITIFNPLGGVYAQLKMTPGQALLTWKGKQYQAETPHVFVKNLLGYSLPLEYFAYWIRANPAPMSDAQQQISADQKTVTAIQQQGWQVKYISYDESAMPKKIELVSPVGQAVVRIKRWIKY